MINGAKNVIIHYLNKKFPEFDKYQSKKFGALFIFSYENRALFWYNIRQESIGFDATEWYFLKDLFSLKEREIGTIIMCWSSSRIQSPVSCAAPSMPDVVCIDDLIKLNKI